MCYAWSFGRFLILGVALMFALAGSAAAHPLGNFTINHLSKLSFDGQRATLHYVLDMAEIPTFQAMRAVTPDGKMNVAQLAAWATAEGQELAPQLKLQVAGNALPFSIVRTAARTRPGAGGLPLMYFTLDASAMLPASATDYTYRDGTFAGRLGWRDVVVAPATEPTHELLAYPSALLGSPRNLAAIDIALASGGRAPVISPIADDGPVPGSGLPSSIVKSNQLSDMLAKGTGDWTFVFFTFLVAIALGALHALEPGHGKTLLAISLVGARATVKQATILASALTVAHTIGVIALGVAISMLKGYFVPESIYPWITLVSGIVIAVIGARALQRQLRLRQTLQTAHPQASAHWHDHDHAHGHSHDHSHGHSHDHGDADDLAHARSHAIAGSAPLTFGGTVWAAMSGGVAPCPAALVVLLAAIALNQVAYGVFVIIAFSFGLAATLTGLGIAVVRGASWLQGRPQFERFVRFGPLVSAVVIASIGAIMVGQGFAQQGALESPIAITLLTALTIAVYAFSYLFIHRTAEASKAQPSRHYHVRGTTL